MKLATESPVITFKDGSESPIYRGLLKELPPLRPKLPHEPFSIWNKWFKGTHIPPSHPLKVANFQQFPGNCGIYILYGMDKFVAHPAEIWNMETKDKLPLFLHTMHLTLEDWAKNNSRYLLMSFNSTQMKLGMFDGVCEYFGFMRLENDFFNKGYMHTRSPDNNRLCLVGLGFIPYPETSQLTGN